MSVNHLLIVLLTGQLRDSNIHSIYCVECVYSLCYSCSSQLQKYIEAFTHTLAEVHS